MPVVYKYSLLLFVLFSLLSCVGKKKYKELLRNNEQAVQEIDVLRRDLAEAKREWAKCKDQKMMSSQESSEELQRKNIELNSQKEKYSDLNKVLLKTRDSLQQTINVMAQLQSNLGSQDQLQLAREKRVKELQVQFSKLTTDLAPYGLTLQRQKDKLFVQMTDSLLFSGKYLSQQGRKVVQGIASVLVKSPDFYIEIEGYSEPIVSPAELWKNSTRRAMSVAIVLNESNIPIEKIYILGRGEYIGTNKADLPVQLIISLEDPRFGF